MLFGYGIDLMLYKNVIDYIIGLYIFSFFGLYILFQNLFMTSEIKSTKKELEDFEEPEAAKGRKSIAQKPTEMKEINEEKKEGEGNEERLLEDNEQNQKELVKDVVVNIEDEEKEKLLTKEKEQNNHPFFDKAYFFGIMGSMAVAECGDSTQFTSMSMAAVFDFRGVLIGSTSALILTIILAEFLGKYITKIISERVLKCFLGITLIFYAAEILFQKIEGVTLVK